MQPQNCKHMITFIIALLLLIVGFFTYGVFVEKVFGIEPERQTPALTKTDGVDFVPMAPWRIFLVQFLNIAGLGPIFGAIMGIFYGPAAFLWIVFGTIFAGGVHDYLSGMLSIRKGGASLPDIVGDELGNGVKVFIRILSLVLLILLTTTFLSGPATLLQGLAGLKTMQFSGHMIPIVWVLIIFGYYALATVLPVDKLIGRFYPIFGGILLFMGLGIMVVMLCWHSGEMPEVFDGLQNRQTNGLPLFPMMFVSIACGAISGFHGTQSPIMARCVTNERQGRWIFYGAMVAEGILALIWAAAAGTFFADPEKGLYGIDGLQAFAAEHPGENIAALVIDKVSRSWLGTVGGILESESFLARHGRRYIGHYRCDSCAYHERRHSVAFGPTHCGRLPEVGPETYFQPSDAGTAAVPLRVWHGVRRFQYRVALFRLDQPIVSSVHIMGGHRLALQAKNNPCPLSRTGAFPIRLSYCVDTGTVYDNGMQQLYLNSSGGPEHVSGNTLDRLCDSRSGDLHQSHRLHYMGQESRKEYLTFGIVSATARKRLVYGAKTACERYFLLKVLQI